MKFGRWILPLAHFSVLEVLLITNTSGLKTCNISCQKKCMKEHIGQRETLWPTVWYIDKCIKNVIKRSSFKPKTVKIEFTGAYMTAIL